MAIANELTHDIDGAVLEISEHRLDATHAQGDRTTHINLTKIPAKTAIDLEPYQQDHYCDSTDNCMVRFSVKDASGKVIAQDHVFPGGLAAVKADA